MILDVIQELEMLSKQGESYSNGKGRYGWRNPVRKDTGPILTQIVSDEKPTRILEIGTGHGLSTLYLAMGFDTGKGEIQTLEFDEIVAQSTQHTMNRCGAPVSVVQGDASETIPTLQGHFDLVFFDAQKDQYFSQLMLLLEHQLIGPGSVILADNVTDRRTECQPFLEWFDNNKVRHQILDTECGLLVARI
jgi:predicted O-methyltransferase YrrM